MRIKIQPRELSNYELPYPYFIYANGNVGRQDFWKGHPFTLVGFNRKPIAGNIDLYFEDWWKVPPLCFGMYPVFLNKDGTMFTLKTEIQTVEVEHTIDETTFSVSSKDLLNKKKNPTLSLSPKDIIKNSKISKKQI